MHDLKYLPISCLETAFLFPLMEEEKSAWMNDLGWDYSPIRRILVSFMNQKLLPGYAAVCEKEAIGYTYFLMNKGKGIIGTIYVAGKERSQEATDQLLSLTITALKDSQRIRRVEAQIMPFNGCNHSDVFARNGFSCHPRYYLDLDLGSFRVRKFPKSKIRIAPWDNAYLTQAAGIVLDGYRDQADALLCSDYHTVSGCEGYLHSIVENPGCGIFMPETSFVGLDENNQPCAFIIGCSISSGVGMIPQIAVHPEYQGLELGKILVNMCFERFKKLGFGSVTLTVTPENRRAYEWYVRLGFKIVKKFGAYIWERDSEAADQV
jgi:ribosomal protein S18 acetylase RimI-like enzyme